MYQHKQKQLVREIEAAVQRDVYSATTIAAGADFANDPRRCLTSVVFVPREIAELIESKIINPLKAIEPEHYFYPLGSLHLTIKNIQVINNPPTFTAEHVAVVSRLYAGLIPQFESFTFTLEDVIQFPTSVSLMGYCDERLQKLVQSLHTNLEQIGVPDNKKLMSDSVFFGNITFCRFAHEPGQAFKEKLRSLRQAVIGELSVKEISLISCNSACAPNSLQIFGKYQLK